MEYLDNSLLIGIFLGFLFWTIFQYLFNRPIRTSKKYAVDEIDDYNGFLEIPFDHIMLAEEQGKEKDIKSLVSKIQAFKARNRFYRDENFVLERGLDDLTDLI